MFPHISSFLLCRKFYEKEPLRFFRSTIPTAPAARMTTSRIHQNSHQWEEDAGPVFSGSVLLGPVGGEVVIGSTDEEADARVV